MDSGMKSGLCKRRIRTAISECFFLFFLFSSALSELLLLNIRMILYDFLNPHSTRSCVENPFGRLPLRLHGKYRNVYGYGVLPLRCLQECASSSFHSPMCGGMVGCR